MGGWTMKKLIVAGAILALAAGPAMAQQKTVKIGFISTFSGPTAVIGNDMRNSFELALDHLGRKMGGLPVEVIYEDDQQKPEVGKQKTEKVIQSDHVNFIAGYIWSNVLLASLKPAVDSQTFIISANAGPSQIAGELCSPFFFSTSWQNDQTPMAMGEYLNQYAQAGLKGQIPLYTAFTIDETTLPLQKDVALGVPGAQEWVNDLPNPANQKFVADFRAKHGHGPSFYGAQAYDAVNLINSAVVALKGDLTKKDAIRNEMRKANYASVRGPYKYGNNHFPIQNFYLQDVVKDAEGNLTLKTVQTIVKDSQDRYH